MDFKLLVLLRLLSALELLSTEALRFRLLVFLLLWLSSPCLGSCDEDIILLDFTLDVGSSRAMTEEEEDVERSCVPDASVFT